MHQPLLEALFTFSTHTNPVGRYSGERRRQPAPHVAQMSVGPVGVTPTEQLARVTALSGARAGQHWFILLQSRDLGCQCRIREIT